MLQDLNESRVVKHLVDCLIQHRVDDRAQVCAGRKYSADKSWLGLLSRDMPMIEDATTYRLYNVNVHDGSPLPHKKLITIETVDAHHYNQFPTCQIDGNATV